MKTWEATAREHLRECLTAGLLAVTAQTVMRSRVRHAGRILDISEDPALAAPSRLQLDLARFDKVRLAAFGKASLAMAAQAEAWGPFDDTLVVTNERFDLHGFRVIRATHPTPSASSVEAGRALMEMARATGPRDLLLVLVSGGGSAIVEDPLVPIEDLARANELALAEGLDIESLACVRKHLSRVKGGGLVRACGGRLVALHIADVPRDDPALVAGGTTATDATTFARARHLLERHGLWDAVPTSVRETIESGRAGKIPETLKPDEPEASRATNLVLAGNATALHAAGSAAKRCGYAPLIFEEGLGGDAREAGHDLAGLARRALAGDLPVSPPCAVLIGGETTVRVQGSGKGGRNQEVALGAVEGLSGLRAAVACFATDGKDGPTDAAGAVVDGLTLARANKLGLDPAAHLAENDAYPFFRALDDLIETGPTGTNVRDFTVLLVGRG